MSFLIRCMFMFDDGEVVHDETTVSDLPEVQQIEKGMMMLGRHGRLTIEFDPPLIADLSEE